MKRPPCYYSHNHGYPGRYYPSQSGVQRVGAAPSWSPATMKLFVSEDV